MKNENTKRYFYWMIPIFLVVLILGVSYALFSETLIGKKNFVLESNGLKIYLDETNTSEDIFVENAIPTLDRDGVKTDSYKFSLVNDEKQDLDYVIYLVEDDYPNKTPSNSIRYRYTRDENSIDVIRNVPDNTTEDGRYFLEKDSIASGKTYHYTLQMWIDYDAGNEILNTRYSAHIEIEAIQQSGIYKEVVLNGTDPVLSDNLVPVTIASDGTVKKANLKQEWYNYQNQEWANAVVLEDGTKTYQDGEVIPESNIESYFVWIPRYKYKIFNEGNYTDVTELSDTAVQTIEIEFESKDTPVSSGTKKDEWLSHPAFQAFDSSGFWVGKFETGYRGATTTEEAEVNSSDSSKLIIKPDVYSWRGINIGNAFKASYEYLREDESHMMKNTEWGAVAYLQHSAYGSSQSVRVNNNNSFKTGHAAIIEPTLGYNGGISIEGNIVGASIDATHPYNTAIGYTASTTKNITGIYDMSGGAHEYVMGYNEDASIIGGKSEITGFYTDFFTNNNWYKYYDKYENAVDTDTAYNNQILGDATGELGPFGNLKDPDNLSRHLSSWYSDYAFFVTPSNPWFRRSGAWRDGVGAGIFYFYRSSGDSDSFFSFRLVLVP